jgi:pimeloyl-ACP methyl ester carboxylesterase
VSTYLLVHGSWHGAWCWQHLAPCLRVAGHLVVAPDLPGHGQDCTPLRSIQPGGDVARLIEVLEALVEPAILVGHSSGGMVISALSEQRPERVRALVYLAGFLLPRGVAPPVVMRTDTESKLQAALLVDKRRSTVSVRRDALRDVFYNDCSDEDFAWARAQLQAEPLRPPMADAETAPEIGQSPPRFYIETLRDHALGPRAQRRMYTALPCRTVYSLDTSHSPFISAPRELAECLLDIDHVLSTDNRR